MRCIATVTVSSLALALACASPPPPVAIRSRADLVSALSELARARRAECGCTGSTADPWLEEGLRMTYEDVPSHDASASALCIVAAERALAAGCATVAIPAECDRAALASVPTPSMFVGKGASCNYAFCASGLVCRGEEEAECVVGRAAVAAGSLCTRAYELPPFAP